MFGYELYRPGSRLVLVVVREGWSSGKRAAARHVTTALCS
jgi:hypothetical protein